MRFPFLFFGLFDEGGDAAGAGGGAGGAAAAAPGTLFAAAAGEGAQGGAGAQAGAAAAGAQGAQGAQGGAAATPNFWQSAVDEQGNFKPDWTNTLPDDLKPAAETLKNYKTPGEALRALHSTKVLLGSKGQTVPILTPNSKPEEVAAYRKAFGVPEKAEDYGLVRPTDLPKDAPWDDAAAKSFADIMLKHHVPKAAAQELMAAEIAGQKAAVERGAAAEKQFITDGITSLRGEWGENFTANMAKAHSMIAHLGLTEDHPALAFPEVVKALLKAHSIISSEDGRVQGLSMLGNDPGQEAKRIQTDPNHALHKLYTSNDPATVTHVRTLLQQAEKIQR